MIEVNFSNSIVVLVDDVELRSAALKNIKIVDKCLSETYGACKSSYEAINSSPGMRCYTFKKFFVRSPNALRRVYDKTWVESVYEFVLSGDNNAPEALVQAVLGLDYLDYRVATKVDLRRSLWLLLVLLFKDRCLLLTPLLKANQYKYKSSVNLEFGLSYYPELMRFTVSARSKVALPDFWKDVDLRVRERVAQYGARLFWIIGACVPEDLTIENLVAVHKKYFYENERLTAELPVHTIIYFVCSYFEGRVKFAYDDLYHALNELRPSKYKSGAKGELTAIDFSPIMDRSESNENLVAYCRLMVRAQFMPDTVEKNPILADLGFARKPTLSRWIAVQEMYCKKKRYEHKATSLRGLSLLNIYLFVYLDKWFNLFGGENIAYPDHVSELGLNFVAPAAIADCSPLPLESFLKKMTDGTTTAKYSAHQQLKSFFAWMEAKNIKDEKGEFINCLSELDMPPSGGLPSSDKRPFRRVEYGIAINYLYCIFLALKKLNGDILANNYSNIAHGDLQQRALALGWVNEFYHGGRKYVVETLPKCFFQRWRFPCTDGADKTIFSPHLIVHILAAVESGLRHQSIQWLCTNFDKHVLGEVELNKPYWLHVVADKTNKQPIKTIVSGQTILALRYQRSIRDMVSTKSFGVAKFYENRIDNVREEYIPLFSKALDSGDPHADELYSRTYLLFLVGYQEFLKSHGHFCKFYELKPNRFGYGEKIIPNKVVVLNVASPYCPIRVVTDMTPHHTRNSTVKVWQRIMSDSGVGKYKTGQGVRTVRYYANLIEEDYDEISAKVGGELSRIWEGERIDPSHPDSNFRQALAGDISQALRDFNCMTMTHAAIIDSSSALNDLRHKYGSGIEHHATHICTKGDVCPQSVIDQGLVKRCGLCIFSVKGIDNIPAIDVKIYNLSLEVEELHAYADSVPEKNIAELERVDEALEQTVSDLLGWTWCRDYLVECFRRDSKSKQKLISIQPELLKKSMREVEMDDSSLQYVFSMLYENNLYPELQSDVVRAKYNFLKLSLIGGGVSVADIFKPVSYDSAQLVVAKVQSVLRAKNIGLEDFVLKLAANEAIALDEYSPIIMVESGE